MQQIEKICQTSDKKVHIICAKCNKSFYCKYSDEIENCRFCEADISYLWVIC